MKRLLVLTAAALAAAALAPVAGAVRAVVSSPAVDGSELYAIGLDFAPPNEFCSVVRLRVDGTLVAPIARRADDAGTWAIRFRANQGVGLHRIRLSQTCENGNTGAETTRSATVRFRIQ